MAQQERVDYTAGKRWFVLPRDTARPFWAVNIAIPPL